MQHPKNLLIERAKQLGLGKPSFSTRNTGLEHEPLFESTVTVGRKVYGRGEGGTKRDAERLASEDALEALSRSVQTNGRSNQVPRPEATANDSEEPFNGPWPIFPKVLAASLSVAHARVNPTLMGTEAIEAVQSLALQLYKGTLENLGEVTEIDVEEALDENADEPSA